MRKTNRILCMVLSLVLVLSAVPALAFAEEAPALPTATITELKNDLTFAMNFKADAVTEEQLAYYGDWYADFELTVNKDVTFNANGGADGYLSGQYDAWSSQWVNVPGTDVTLNANESLKIMDFAAKLMNKEGLKVTFNDIVTGVKDFDCGVYFEPAYLAANPDLEVTLELRMYDPEDETKSYTIGETYSFTNTYLAQCGGELYNNLSTALVNAQAGETVTLLEDTTVDHISVYEDVKLDLNGNTLSARYVTGYGDIVDNSADNSGVLVVEPSRFMLQSSNTQLPVYNGTGYQFVEVLGFNTATLADGRYAFQTLFEPAAHELMNQGAAVSKASVQVDVSWTQDGNTRTQQFVYKDSMVQQVLSSYNASTGKYTKMFTLSLSGAENFENLTTSACVVSTTGVRFAPVVVEQEQGNVTTNSNSEVAEAVTLTNENATAVVAEGTLLEEGVNSLTLTTTEMTETTSNITVTDDEQMISMDVHVEGVSADNTVPVIVTLDGITLSGLNQGNITLYHVENGVTSEMTRVYTLEEVDAHNEYYYNIETGTVTVALASFSEVAVVSDTVNAWNGKRDYTWYDADKTELTIANADQLAGFSAIVGGMDGQTQDSFAGKTVKLISDINIGDLDSENGIVFYPIGYYNTDGTYEKTNTAITSGFETFEGTFDGGGHTISNIYQNTWEMKGDHNWYDAALQYYRDGMGLFGKVYGGTVKNLNVQNFSSDGEIATTGTIAAYADCGATFENISIFNCNPRVYNIGNGGIVGCVGWYTNDEHETPVTFKNITVDNTNKISALWGSWDVPCGGIVGQYYPTSGQSNAIANKGISMINCHVAAQIDVNNDVCANYQYYAYRYAGMLIGSVRENETIDGRVYPKMDGITFEDCTVTYGDWVNYYYCELIANSSASYTHDYQFSRLTLIDSVTDIQDESGNWNVTGNYMTLEDDTRTCYHIMKDADGSLYRHEHDDTNTQEVNGANVPVEDHRCVYLPFDQLVTGYGWGVTSKGIEDLDGVEVNKRAASATKFQSTAAASYTAGTQVTIGELFTAAVSEDDIIDGNVQVIVTPVANADGTVTSTAAATYVANTTDWAQGTLTFSGEGAATITISDYYYCKTTTITVSISKAIEKVDPEVAAPTGLTATYGDTLADVALPKGFAWQDDSLSVGNAGTNSFTAIYTPEDTEKYNVIEVSVEVAVAKATPSYVVPTGLTATYGDDLSTVALPSGFSWASTGTVGNAGTNSFTASYTPTETGNYETVDSITVSVTVAPISVAINEDNLTNYGTFLYRVGNLSSFGLRYLFTTSNNALNLGTVTVTATDMSGKAVTVTTSGTTMSALTADFDDSFTGPVTLTVSGANIESCSIKLEVVKAKNAVSATSATANNVVLLTSCGLSDITVSGGYTLYGNGFTMSTSTDSYATDRTYAWVKLSNGTIDNVIIVAPNPDYAVLYHSNMSESGNRSYTDSTGKTRYYNVKSAVIVEGNSNILNSYISGGRAAVYVLGGTAVIDNTTIEGGGAANIHIEAANSLLLKDITLIQRPIVSSYDSAKTLMGLSVIAMCDGNGLSAPITLEGSFTQYAWAHEGYAQYVPEAGQSFVSTVLKETDYVHKITYSDGETRDSINLGFLFMPGSTTSANEPVANEMIIDKRSDKTTIPYGSICINSSAYVYSYAISSGTSDSFSAVPEYNSNSQSASAPSVSYSDTNENRVFATAYDETTGWTSSLTVDVDAGVYSFSFDNLVVTKNQQELEYTVSTIDGTSVDKTQVITLNNSATYHYILTITDPLSYNADGELAEDSTAIHTYYFNLLATKTSLPAPTWVSKELNGTPYIVVDTKDSDWNCAVPVLDGLKVKYWSKKQNKEIELDLANVVSDAGLSAGLQNGSNNTLTITVADEYTLTITTASFKTNDNGKPVVVNDKLYFTVSSSSNYVSTSTTSREPSISYKFTDANNSETLELSTSFPVTYSKYKNTQYKYSDFCNGTLTEASSGCISPDTLITLADGSQKRVDELTYADQLLVWNFNTGSYAVKPASAIVNHGEGVYRIVHLNFSDGTTVKVIGQHGFFEVESNKFVFIDEENVPFYIGRSFVKSNGTGYEHVTLDSYSVTEEYTAAYTILSHEYDNAFVEGMLSITPLPGIDNEAFFGCLVVGDNMKYDEAAINAYIEKHGLYTYEELAQYGVTYEQYVGANLAYMKIMVGEGIVTLEYVLDVLAQYVPG